MRNKAVSLIVVLVQLLFLSCKKETLPSIVGDWVSRSVYTSQANGGFSWTSTGGHSQEYKFSETGQFGSWTDIPSGSGTYLYDAQLRNLSLSYEGDRFGAIPVTVLLKVELLTNDKLVLAIYSSTDTLFYKTEYSRVN